MGVGYTQNRSIEFIPAAAIQQGSNYPIEHMQTNTQIEQTNNQVSPNPSPQQRSIEQIQIQPITHTQNQPIAHTQNQPIAHTQNQPALQLAQECTDNPGTIAAYNRPIGYEENSYLCSWCETPTKFKDRKKLSKHIKRFHNAFDQKNRGVKRGDDDLDEIAPKRQRGDNKYNLNEFDDDDNNEGYDEKHY